jgi:outer membrane protein assembly factor BamB
MIDGDRVYAVSCRGKLVCLSVADGKEIWSKSYTKDFGASFIGEKGNVPGAGRHGNNGTPLIVGDRLYACAGGTEGAGVVCLDKRTGEVIWKSQNDEAAYAAPAIAKLGGVEQLLCFTVEGLIALDPAKGELFWRVPIKTAFGRHVTAPVWHDDLVVVSSHQAGMIGTKVKGKTAEQAWISKENAMNFASPVAVGKYLYGLGPRKNLICVEIASGKQMWSKDGFFQTSADKTYGGFVVVGESILCLTDTGTLVLFRAAPAKFEELGQVQVAGANWCNPAYADGRLYLRDGNQGPGNWMCVELGGK